MPMHSNTCPRFFRGHVAQASHSRRGYEEAGYHLAIHARELVDGEVDDAVLASLDSAIATPVENKLAPYASSARAVVAWLEQSLPRCMELVPSRVRQGTFARGIARALEEERV